MFKRGMHPKIVVLLLLLIFSLLILGILHPWKEKEVLFSPASCSLDSDCFDGDDCTIDTCTLETCQYRLDEMRTCSMNVYQSSINGTFLSDLAVVGKTGFPSYLQYVVADAPNFGGGDLPSLFYHKGKMYIMFGDPNTGVVFLSTALAFTQHYIAEHGFDLRHYRNWIVGNRDDEGNGYPDVKSLAADPPRLNGRIYSRPNSAGGVVVEMPDGHERIYFMTYLRYGYAFQESRTQLAYSDDNFTTNAVQDPNLIFWDYYEPDRGTNFPLSYLAYSMREFKGHVYLFFPRSYTTILLRVSLDDLKKDSLSLQDWEYLKEIDPQGNPTWIKGLVMNQITWDRFSHPDDVIPIMNITPTQPDMTSGVTWNPYMNRWMLTSTISPVRIYQAKDFWGPYQQVSTLQHSVSTYNTFTHETLLGKNGKDVYYTTSRWPESGRYGTYYHMFSLTPYFEITLPEKSGVEGETIHFSVIDQTPDLISGELKAYVDGYEATLEDHVSNLYSFSYTLSGKEGNGLITAVPVLAVKTIAGVTYSRDVAFIVNRKNDLHIQDLGLPSGSVVHDFIEEKINVSYDFPVEDLGPGKPNVEIIKVEIQGDDGRIIDADTYPPYTLNVDTRRFTNGDHTFTLIAYDTLDRRATLEKTYHVENVVEPKEGNLIIDGDMESENLNAWGGTGGTTVLTKIANGKQFSGARGLLVNKSVSLGFWGGAQTNVTGLVGGENLRLTGFYTLESCVQGENLGENKNLLFQLYIYDSQYRNIFLGPQQGSFGQYLRFNATFQNPPGNTKLSILLPVYESNQNATCVQLYLDNVVLESASAPLVSPPDNLDVNAGRNKNSISWNYDQQTIDQYFVYRKLTSEDESSWKLLTALEEPYAHYVDTQLEGLSPDAYSYSVSTRDHVGVESQRSMAVESVCVDSDLDGIDDCLDHCTPTLGAEQNAYGCPTPLFNPEISYTATDPLEVGSLENFKLVSGTTQVDYTTTVLDLTEHLNGNIIPLNAVSSVAVGNSFISINESKLNHPALVSMHIAGLHSPLLFQDDHPCTTCSLVDYSDPDLTFSIQGYGSYSVKDRYCGNGIVEDGEVCDGGTSSCTIEGYLGEQECSETCERYLPCQSLENCGDGSINGNEECDGLEFPYPNANCENINPSYASGLLTCTSSCSIDQTTCVLREGCYDFDGDGFIGYNQSICSTGTDICEFSNQTYLEENETARMEILPYSDIVRISPIDNASILRHENLSILLQDLGEINFTEKVDLSYINTQGCYEALNLSKKSYLSISKGKIFINSTELIGFNVSATLTFYGLNVTLPKVLRDGQNCSSPICEIVNYSNGTAIINVTSFSTYEIVEGFIPSPPLNTENPNTTQPESNPSPRAKTESSTSPSKKNVTYNPILIQSDVNQSEGPQLPTPCQSQWNCSEWSDCSNGIQNRSCFDISYCNRTENTPLLNQTCTLEKDNSSQTPLIIFLLIILGGAVGLLVLLIAFIVKKNQTKNLLLKQSN